MTRKAIRSGLMTSLMVATALSLAAWASFDHDGVSVSAGGVEMTVKASLDRGLQVSFVAPN